MKKSGCYTISLLVLVLMSACSSTTFMYNRLHIFIPWYVDDYVDLNSRQNDRLDQLLIDYLNYHRLEHLPRYVAILDQAAATLDDEVTRASITALYNRSQDELERLQTESLDWMLTVGESLTEQQIDDFAANLREKQDEYKEELLERNEQEFREETYENLKDNFTDYLGRLNREQKAVLQQTADEIRRWDNHWIEEREKWVESLIELLDRQPGWQQQVRDLVGNRYNLAPVEYKAAFEHNLNVIMGTLVSVVNSRTESQDRHLRKKLNSLRDDLCQLIAQGLEAKEPEKRQSRDCESLSVSADAAG